MNARKIMTGVSVTAILALASPVYAINLGGGAIGGFGGTIGGLGGGVAGGLGGAGALGAGGLGEAADRPPQGAINNSLDPKPTQAVKHAAEKVELEGGRRGPGRGHGAGYGHGAGSRRSASRGHGNAGSGQRERCGVCERRQGLSEPRIDPAGRGDEISHLRPGEVREHGPGEVDEPGSDSRIRADRDTEQTARSGELHRQWRGGGERRKSQCLWER